MDLDVFGPTDESKVVILGEDNVVIVKDVKGVLTASEEISEATSGLSIVESAEPKAFRKEEPASTEDRSASPPTPDQTLQPQQVHIFV